MPYYNDLRPEDDFMKRDYALIFPNMVEVEKKRTIENLLELRAGLREKIAPRKADDNLLIASWNIKEFGHTTQRLHEAYFYLTEILSHFDLIIIQEVKSTMKDLYIILKLLGHDWKYVVNDITEGHAGNSERSAYVFNTKRVEFAGLAGEIVLWDKLTENSEIKQLKRTPYITGFKSGWKTFSIINLHLHPGDQQDDITYRRREVELLLKAFEEKISSDHFWNENIILAGDFNFYNGPDKDDETIRFINQAGYKEVGGLKGKDTNASQTAAYDRLFITSTEYFTLGKNEQGLGNGDVFNPFDYVYKTGQEQVYKEYMKTHYTGKKNLDDPVQLTKYFKHPWRKNQISDHFPIWFELIVDSSDKFLAEKLSGF
jgi:endonuclease/exonuclease/phosphatase family metal-dependent hydrolase